MDLTPDIETGGSKMGTADDETIIDLKNVTSVPTPSNQSNNINMANSTSVADLLSPPDISLTTSISPGEETDATVTITPSSATNTPSQSTEMGKIFLQFLYIIGSNQKRTSTLITRYQFFLKIG